MKTRSLLTVAAKAFTAFTLVIQPSAQADTFGSGANTFGIDFVDIGNAGNAAQITPYTTNGAVPYDFRIGKYEISQNQIDNATASGLANVTAGAWAGKQPAANISWYEAAAFVNWLNTSTGKQAAYDLTWDGSAWSMNLWSSEQAWTLGGTNFYRHKDAYYFLPSTDEWWKSAYYNPSGVNYFLYPTGSDASPIAVISGTNTGTAVFWDALAGPTSPAAVDSAGGLSAFGTMAQGGNVWEWSESADDGQNDSPTDPRSAYGGSWDIFDWYFDSLGDGGHSDPSQEYNILGFRVASVPEPSTYALLLMTAASALYLTRKRRP